MLNIIFIAGMLIVLSLGVFFFPTILGLPCLFATLLLAISIMYLFQDIVFKANSVLLGVVDLLLKLSYFSLAFAIRFVEPKSFLSYVFYGSVVLVGLFDMFVLCFKRNDVFMESENKQSTFGFLKHSISPTKLKNQEGIADNPNKLECYKGDYYTKMAFISCVVAMILRAVGTAICRPRSTQVLNLVCLAVICVSAVVAAVFQFVSIKAVKASLGYKLTVLVMVFSASILGFVSEIYLTEIFIGAVLIMLSYIFFTVVCYVCALSSLYYNKQLEKIEKIEE